MLHYAVALSLALDEQHLNQVGSLFGDAFCMSLY